MDWQEAIVQDPMKRGRHTHTERERERERERDLSDHSSVHTRRVHNASRQFFLSRSFPLPQFPTFKFAPPPQKKTARSANKKVKKLVSPSLRTCEQNFNERRRKL